MDTTYTVKCPVDGFENIAVTYNMLASWKEVVALRSHLTAETAKPVIASMAGWDDEKRGPFWGDEVPMAAQLWAAYQGRDEAVRGWVQRPLQMTPAAVSTTG
jgi:hypothetical protein